MTAPELYSHFVGASARRETRRHSFSLLGQRFLFPRQRPTVYPIDHRGMRLGLHYHGGVSRDPVMATRFSPGTGNPRGRAHDPALSHIFRPTRSDLGSDRLFLVSIPFSFPYRPWCPRVNSLWPLSSSTGPPRLRDADRFCRVVRSPSLRAAPESSSSLRRHKWVFYFFFLDSIFFRLFSIVM